MTRARTEIADAAPFDATLWPDGTVEITVCPEDSDNVLVQISGVANEYAATAAIVAAFTDLGRRVAAERLAVLRP